MVYSISCLVDVFPPSIRLELLFKTIVGFCIKSSFTIINAFRAARNVEDGSFEMEGIGLARTDIRCLIRWIG